MNFNDPDSSGSSADDSENEVVPLDFRTALIASDNKIIIQAKPLHFKSVEEDLRDLELQEERRKKGLSTDDDFFQKITKAPFKDTDKDVVFIDPGLNTDEIFGEIDLPCMRETRMNNAIRAPLVPKRTNYRPQSPRADQDKKSLSQAEKLFKPRPQTAVPARSVYKQTKVEVEVPAEKVNREMLSFANILSSMGLKDDLMENLDMDVGSDEDA